MPTRASSSHPLSLTAGSAVVLASLVTLGAAWMLSARTAVSSAPLQRIVASEFVLQDPLGNSCARLHVKEGEPVLEFISPHTQRCQMEIGLGSLGSARIMLRDTYTYGSSQGATLTLTNEGDPGEPVLEMTSAGRDAHASLRVRLSRAQEPIVEFRGGNGKKRRAVFQDFE